MSKPTLVTKEDAKQILSGILAMQTNLQLLLASCDEADAETEESVKKLCVFVASGASTILGLTDDDILEVVKEKKAMLITSQDALKNKRASA
jgi:hypothetical protein